MTVKRVLRMTCMSCGSLQRMKVDPDTEDTSQIDCYECGPTLWMSLPTLRPEPVRPNPFIVPIGFLPESWMNLMHYGPVDFLYEEDD